MTIRVEKVFQSPCTPACEYDYLVIIKKSIGDEWEEDDVNLLNVLENLNIERLKSEGKL